MTTLARRLDRLETCYRDRYADHPARIPAWLRPWIDELSIEDLDILEAGMSHEEAGGDTAALPPETRERYEALTRSCAQFCEEHHP